MKPGGIGDHHRDADWQAVSGREESSRIGGNELKGMMLNVISPISIFLAGDLALLMCPVVVLPRANNETTASARHAGAGCCC
jgi:hypothetical protein